MKITLCLFCLSLLNFLNYQALVATFSKTSRVSFAHVSQEKHLTFSNPLLTRAVLVFASRDFFMPSAIELTSFGLTKIPLSATISGRLDTLDTTTGTPQAWASMTGIPNPSQSEDKT